MPPRLRTRSDQPSTEHVRLPHLSVKQKDSFWSRIHVGAEDECWLWMGGTDGSGYGKFKDHWGGWFRAHRMAYFLHTNRDPGENLVCHACDVRRCCNPKHLFEGDTAANMADAAQKKRMRGPGLAGQQNPAAKITREQAEEIIRLIDCGLPNTEIAAQFPISHGMVSRIRTGKAWRVIPRISQNDPRTERP